MRREWKMPLPLRHREGRGGIHLIFKGGGAGEVTRFSDLDIF